MSGQVEDFPLPGLRQSLKSKSSYCVSWQIIALAKLGHLLGVLRTYHLPFWNVAYGGVLNAKHVVLLSYVTRAMKPVCRIAKNAESCAVSMLGKSKMNWNCSFSKSASTSVAVAVWYRIWGNSAKNLEVFAICPVARCLTSSTLNNEGVTRPESFPLRTNCKRLFSWSIDSLARAYAYALTSQFSWTLKPSNCFCRTRVYAKSWLVASASFWLNLFSCLILAARVALIWLIDSSCLAIMACICLIVCSFCRLRSNAVAAVASAATPVKKRLLRWGSWWHLPSVMLNVSHSRADFNWYSDK